MSTIYGKFMDSRFSRWLIPKFIRKYQIELTECEKKIYEFQNFNDFFYRKLVAHSRSIDSSSDTIISPADGKILVYHNISDHQTFNIKNNYFDIAKILEYNEIVKKYNNSSLAIIRLSPLDYHRFHFPLAGLPGTTQEITGKYYSVSPLALFYKPQIFNENHRTFCEIDNHLLGNFLFVEVGATFVGSIKQTYSPLHEVYKGEEKGYFKFGGSTIILIFPHKTIEFDDDLVKNTSLNLETYIRMGERIGKIKKN